MWGNIFDLTNPLIGKENIWALWTVCVVFVALAIYLEQNYSWTSKLSGAILCLIFALLLSNLGIIPMNSGVWDSIWSYIVPLAIPLLLFQCDMKKIGKEAGQMLILFLLSSVGTILGAIIAYLLLAKYIPELGAIAGMFTGTYIGGGVNFAALADAFKISESMVGASTVADNLLMVLYFFTLIMMPGISFFRKNYAHPHVDEVEANIHKTDGENSAAVYWGRKEISLLDIALSIALAFVIVFLSENIANILKLLFAGDKPINNILVTFFGNKYLWITTISMILATLFSKQIGNIKGSNEIGTFLIYLFFFVIGVPASIIMIITNSPLLLVFAAIIVIINMIVSLTFGKIFGFTLEEIIIASNANIGGPTTAAAMAVSKGWTKLVGPAMLVGTLGYVLGTYAGLLVGSILIR
jgi:hypothetical protein